MTVAVAGAHGRIGLRLCRLLATDGTAVIGLHRNPAHAGEIEAAGARPVVCDLETATTEEVKAAIGDADVLVFAAGAGPGSGAERKLTMDRDGAIRLLDAGEARRARYLMVSAVGAEEPPDDDEVFSVYLRAKAQADAAVMASGRDWTILRPGPLGDEPGTGRVRVSIEPFRGAVTRDDVAALLAALIAGGAGPRAVVYVGEGDAPIADALAGLR